MRTNLETLRRAVERYQKSLENLAAINEELRTLPASERLGDILKMNEETMRTTQRLLDSARYRLEREAERQTGAVDLSPQTA